MTLLAVRFIDVAIFGSLGALWLGGGLFIVVLYRWILRFERGEDPRDVSTKPVRTSVEPERARSRSSSPSRSPMVPTAAASGVLASHS